MKLTKIELREFVALQKELDAKGVPNFITRSEVARLCDDYALDAPMYRRGDRNTAFRRIDVMIYMVRRGVCPTRTSKHSLTL